MATTQTKPKKISRKITKTVVKVADKFVAQKQAEMTPEERSYACLMTAHILMGAYKCDRERGNGLLLNALTYLDTDTYNLFYKHVQKAVADKIEKLEATYANPTTRKPRTRSTSKVESKDPGR